MSMSCGCDEGPEWMRSDARKARKEHCCCECKEAIPAGATYHYVVGRWDGEISTFATCDRCQGLRDSYEAMGYCCAFGWLWSDHYDRLYDLPPEQQSARACDG